MNETIDAVVETGEKLHIITRRNFADDLRRHFAGEVVYVAGDTVRVSGYTFVFNANMMEYRRRPELRTRIFGLADANLIINIIPEDVVLDRLEYAMKDDRLKLLDRKGFELDVNEFGATY